jgi:AcrR family transcriptional regulator
MENRPASPTSPASPSPLSSAPSTRDALMDATIELIEERGVLAGLNLSEVADRVGVTPANIYHLFGSRQGLLRAALTREADRVFPALAETVGSEFVEQRLRAFDTIGERPRLGLTALLALDHDDDYEPLPFLDAVRAEVERQAAAGEIPDGLDIEAMHLVTLGVIISTAIYGTQAARQIGVPLDELRARVRSVFEQVLNALIGKSE